MGFKYWLQGLELIGMFLVVVTGPCFFVGLWGAKMINDIGNNPSKSAQIMVSSGWKIILVEIVFFSLFIGLYIFLYNLQNG
jgi:hypothetical protein